MRLWLILLPAGLYVVPSSLEVVLLHFRMNPWVVCILLGDLPGCAVLFALGHRRTALALYALCGIVEGLLLAFGVLPAARLVWVTNLVPSGVAGVVMANVGLRSLVVSE